MDELLEQFLIEGRDLVAQAAGDLRSYRLIPATNLPWAAYSARSTR